MAGADNADRYYAMLSPALQRELKERIELQLTPLNPEFSAPEQPQTLSIDVKGVNKLIIRTYKINTAAYYRSSTELINSDVDLDGLVPSKETTYDYTQASVIRHRENIALSEIQGRGVWVIDLLGGGLRCRAIIRRGDLHAVVNTHESGHLITVLDEQHQRVADASIRIDAREFTTDKDGRTLIPFLESGKEQVAVLSDGVIATPLRFSHLAESFALEASMFVAKESLIPGRTAELLIRPQLKNAGQDVSQTRIESGTVVIRAKDQNGIETTRRFEKLKFGDSLDTVIEFRVPENCRSLTANLEVDVVRNTNGQREALTVSRSWPVGTFADTRNLNDVYLTKSLDEWVLEVRGRNGEPIRGVPIQIDFATNISTTNISTTAQTNDRSQVSFKENSNLTTVTASIGGQSRTWTLGQQYATFPTSIFATTDDDIRLAITPVANNANGPENGRFTLREFRFNKPTKDLTGRVTVENGFVRIEKLDKDFINWPIL